MQGPVQFCADVNVGEYCVTWEVVITNFKMPTKTPMVYVDML
jgi:hypothetical protein